MQAFSDENFHKSSSLFTGELVEHLTSWLTINPVKGCSLKCAYCFRANWHASEKPTQVASLDECLAALLQHPSFEEHVTPVSINNSSTDALLPSSKATTFDAISKLEKLGYKNPFIIISKLCLSNTELIFLQNLKFVKPIFFSSFSLAPKHIEPTPIEPRIRNMSNLQKSNIPVVLYYRPIVKGWNDSAEIIKTALTIGQKYCDAICIGGLRVSPQIKLELQKVGEDFHDLPNDFHVKIFDEEIKCKILSFYDELNLTVPLFKHSSCAVSYITRRANYNHLYKKAAKNCLKTCPLHQQELCNYDS